MLSATDIASMRAVVAGSLDVPITVQRVASTTPDGYGHASGTPTTVNTQNVNIMKPSASMLTLYAGIIGSQRAFIIRFQGDIKEGDIVVYNGLNWRVHEILTAESYTFSNEALMVMVV